MFGSLENCFNLVKRKHEFTGNKTCLLEQFRVSGLCLEYCPTFRCKRSVACGLLIVQFCLPKENCTRHHLAGVGSSCSLGCIKIMMLNLALEDCHWKACCSKEDVGKPGEAVRNVFTTADIEEQRQRRERKLELDLILTVGEGLTFRYNKPREATVRAVTNGALWVLEREAFRHVLLMKYLNRPLFKILRSVEMFSKLSLSHLHSLTEALNEVSYAPGETIVEKVSNHKADVVVALL